MQKIPVRRISSGPRESRNSARLSIREVQQIGKGKGIVHELHRHDFFFILTIQKGSGIHEIDFIPYHVTNSSIFILRPGQVHRLELNEGSTGFLLEFDPAFYQPKNKTKFQRWNKAITRNYCLVKAEEFIQLNAILTNIFHEFTAKKEGYIDAIVANLDLFFIEYGRQSQNSSSITQTNKDYNIDRLEELLRLLEANIASMKNVSQYARLLNLSNYQLNAITKSVIGKTVSELINEQIILEAKRNLLATSMQVKEIADSLGYEDVSYFIRFFKKQTGHTPDAFRRNFK